MSIQTAPQRYALLYDTEGYCVRLPEGFETRWIPDLCAELNGLHAELRAAQAERDEALRSVEVERRIRWERNIAEAKEVAK